MTGILGALPQRAQTADADDSTFSYGLKGESLEFMHSESSHSHDSEAVMSSALGPEGQSPSLVQSKETPSDSAEGAVDIVDTLGQQVQGIQVSFNTLPEILQHLIDAATVAEALSKDRDVLIPMVVALVGAIMFYIFYLVYYTLRDGIIFAQ